MIGWVGVVPISEASAVYSVIFPHFSQTVWGEKWKSKKRKGKNKKQVLLRFIFKLSYQMFSLSAFCRERVHFTLWNYFQKTPELYNPWNFSKPDLSSGAHMGNQTLPSIPAASFLCLKNVCRSLSTVWNYSPGWAEKRQSGKECHLDSIQCPSFVMTPLHSTGTTYRNVFFFFFVVHYKLLLQILFFVVMLRKKKIL